MKVLYIHRTQGKGVEQVHVQGIVRAFHRAGWKIDILGPPGIKLGCVKNQKIKRNKKNSFYRYIAQTINEPFFEICELCYNIVSFFRVFIRLIFGNYELVYERYSLFNLGSLIAAKLFSVPIVMEVNDSANIERSRNLHFDKLARWLEKNILNNANLVVTVSNAFKNKLVEAGIDGEKILITANAVDSEEWADLNLKNDKNKIIRIVFIAAFVKWHKPGFMIETFGKLCSMHENIRLLMVGNGPELIKAQKKAQNLNIASQIVFTGHIETTGIKQLLSTCHIGVMAHSNEHGSPMKIFEYMAAGLAVVAPKFAPICEVIENHVTGLIFEPLNTDKFVHCLSRLILDHGLRSQLGIKAREHVLKRHTWDKNLSRVLGMLPSYTPVGEYGGI